MEPLIDELSSRKPSGVVFIQNRELAFAEYGDPQGVPVFYFSGGDSSRLEGLSLDEAARDLGIRVVAPDRPGFGASDPQDGRSLTDWPQDVRAIAEHLGIETFSVLGLSGGGPHALVTAWAMPDRVRSVVVVASAPPPEFEELAKDVAFPFRLVSMLTRRAPWALEKLLSQQQRLCSEDPAKLLRQTRRGVGDADARYLVDEAAALYVAAKRLGYRQGVDSSVQEHLLYRAAWGFELADIEVPTTVVIGAEDVMASSAANQAIAGAIPGSQFVEIAGEGHLSLIPNQASRLLSRVIDARAELDHL